MHWIPLLIVGAILVAVLMLIKSGQISVEEARNHLKNGALVIDVRTPEEFRAGHLAQASNIPLDEITTAVPRQVKDRNQILLLHCASGMRSGMAQKQLRSLGYLRVFNLGSFTRAQHLLPGN